MTTIRITKNINKHLNRRLRVTKTTTTWATFWRIHHKSPEREEIKLKVARYEKTGTSDALPEDKTEKQGLTLDGEETQNLVNFLRDDYEPFKKGFNKYIPLGGEFNPESIHHLKAIFESPEKQKALDFIANNDLLADELMAGLQNRSRVKAVKEFENMLGQDLAEPEWQKWFECNDWVLGVEFVRILDEQKIDVSNIPDYLMETHDGFLDIVEIKRPEGRLKFWAHAQDHGNYVQSSDLTKAITQATKYIYKLEREANNVDFLKRVANVETIKPRCILIFGRSDTWNDGQKEAYRILNSSFHNLTIMTYDHVLDRAKKILGMDEPEENQNADAQVHGSHDYDDDIPF